MGRTETRALSSYAGAWEGVLLCVIADCQVVPGIQKRDISSEVTNTRRCVRVLVTCLAPHTSGPRDVPRCGALSLLQKGAAIQGGDPAETAAMLNVMWTSVADCLTGGGILTFLTQSFFESI